MTCLRQESSSILGWLMNAAAIKCIREFDLRINDNHVWVNEVIAEAKKTLAVEDIKLLPKTPSAKSRARRCQRPLRSNALDNVEEDEAADPVSKKTRRKAGKRLKFGENLAAGERSQLEEVDEDEEVKENVGKCRNISAENLDDKSTSAVPIAEHITEIANKGKVPTVSTDTEQESDPRAILSMASAILDGTYASMLSPKFNISSNNVPTSTRKLLGCKKSAMVAQPSQESASCIQNSIRKSTSVEKCPPKKALQNQTVTRPQNTTKGKSLRLKARLSTTRRRSRKIGTRASSRKVAKKDVILIEDDCDDVEMKNVQIQVDLSDEEATEGKRQTVESKTLTNCDVKETILPPSSATRSKSRKIKQLQEMLCGDPSFALKSVQAPSNDKPRNDQCRSIKRQQESGNDADDATNKRHRKDADVLSPGATEYQNSRSVAKAGTYVSSCYPVLKKTPNSQNTSVFLQRSAVKIINNQDTNDEGFKNVMIKVKRIEEINQRRNEELQKKADERKKLREEQHISVLKRRQELEQSAVKKAMTPKAPERSSVLEISTLERSKLSVLRKQKLEIEQKRKAEESKRLEKERQIHEERKRVEEEKRQQLIAEQKQLEEGKRLKTEQERLKLLELQKLKEQEEHRKRLQQKEEEERKLMAERERVQMLELQKLKEQEAQKLKIQEQKLKEQELQKLKEREQMERQQRAFENKQLEEKKRQALLMNQQEMAGGQKQNHDQVLKEQNNSSKQNVVPMTSSATAPVKGVVHHHPIPEKGSNLNKTFEVDESCKSSKHNDCESYEMTPCVKKPKVSSNNSNYNIDDLNSDDSTDDETRPRKKIPYWAQGKDLKISLINQFTNLPDDVDAMFGQIYNPDLNLIFANKIRTRFNKRTSSANWDEPLLPKRK